MNNGKNMIGIIIIATGKYIDLFPDLYSSIKENLFLRHNIKFFLMTNTDVNGKPYNDAIIKIIKIKDEKWPFVTLKRYEYITLHRELFSGLDYIFYCDVDMRVFSEVGEEIFPRNEGSGLVGVEHPGYCMMKRPRSRFDVFLKKNKLPHGKVSKRMRGPYESNPASTAYVADNEGDVYCQGAFQGGRREEFLMMAEKLAENTKIDLKNDIIAVFHDESHMNRYFIDHPPKILSPGYCYPENWNLPFEKKILALDKPHEEIRKKETDLDSEEN